MPKILALEASTEQCSAAILDDSKLYSSCSNKPRAHAQSLLPMVDSLLSQSDLSLADLDCIAYDCGPGSFTGLRICLGVAQGLSFGANLDLLGINSLEAMAHAAHVKFKNSAEGALCLLDARMGELYWAVYLWGSEKPNALIEPRLDHPNEFEERFNQQCSNIPLVAVGPGVTLLSEQAIVYQDSDASIYPTAESVATLAGYKLESGCLTAPENAELTYLRNEVSWNKRQRIRQP